MTLPLKPRFSSYIAMALGSLMLIAHWPLATADDKDKKSLNEKVKEIAGTAEFLRSVPKFFATLKAVDPAQHQVTLLVDGESLPKVWRIAPDAEIKRAGWWGRLNQFPVGDRVWVWFETDRNKQPVAVSMLADELTEEEMHGKGVILEAFQGDEMTLKSGTGNSRTLNISKAEFLFPKEKAQSKFKVGERVFVQSSRNHVRQIMDATGLEELRTKQKAALRKLWIDQGLPGTVVFLHRFSGEMDFMLDHEAMRWGRSLKAGDKVTLRTASPITAVVKQVQPWRERTQLRLVVAAADQGDLAMGQRVFLQMPPPSVEVENASLPPDLDRPRTKSERIEWFLASIYCTCGVKGDTCTGHFYTLASCNPNGCGMPNQMRKVLAEKIDKGLTDKQILEELLKENGPDLLRPHLLP